MQMQGGDDVRCTATLGHGVFVELCCEGMGMGLTVSTRDGRRILEELERAISSEELSNANQRD